MLCSPRRELARFTFLLAVILFGTLGDAFRAETIDYSADPRLTATTLRMPEGRVTLAELLWQIKEQGGIDPGDIPADVALDSVLHLPAGEALPLSQLLYAASVQTSLVFEHHGGELSARPKHPGDVIVELPKPAEPVTTLQPESTAAAPAPAPDGSDAAAVAAAGTATAAVDATADAATSALPAAPDMTSIGDFSSLPTPPAPPAGEAAAAAETDNVITLAAVSVKGTAGGKNSMLTERKQATGAVEFLGAADFSKFIATDVADISVRMPGISTTSKGTFAVVRGLAERYNPVMLDGIVLPSTDPERQSPELDIFPTRLVEAIVIAKTFDPSMPGTASGAGIDLRAKPIPQGRFAQVQFGLKADAGYLKNEPFLGSDRKGIWDYFAFGVKDRAKATDGDRNNFAYVRSPNTVTNVQEKNFPLGGRFSVTYEDRIDIDTETGSVFGYGISFGYDRSASIEEGETMTVQSGVLNLLSSESSGSTVNVVTGAANQGNMRTGEFDISAKKYREAELETRFGLLVNLGYAFNRQHKLAYGAFWSQIGIDQHSENTAGLKYENVTYADFDHVRTQVNDGLPKPIIKTGLDVAKNNESIELYYRQRQLYDLHLGGEHDLGTPFELKANWILARIGASQEEPEYLDLLYAKDKVNGADSYSLLKEKTYTRYWRSTKEGSRVARLDLAGRMESLLEGMQFKAGVYLDRSDRDYREVSWSFDILELKNTSSPTRQLMIENMATATFSPVSFSNVLFPAYAKGERSIDAGYISSTLTLFKNRPWMNRLDLHLGVRHESFSLDSKGHGRVANEDSGTFYYLFYRLKKDAAGVLASTTGSTFSGKIDEKKLLPVIALNYSPNKSLTVRLAASKTTARPSFREVGSYFTVDQIADEFIHGNKDLKTSDVRNYDFRMEYFFPKSKDLVALSLFKKTISNPIERTTMTGIGSIAPLLMGPVSTFVNNDNDAHLRGMEFEFAKSLRFIGGPAQWFSLGGNATLIDAEVKRHPLFELAQITSTGIKDERPLFDQPRWIANANITFDHRPSGLSATLSYFAISEILQKVNTFTWDSYTAQRDRWDFSLSQKFLKTWQVRFQASNLSDPVRKTVADPNNTNEEIVYRSYKDGRSYSLSVSHEF